MPSIPLGSNEHSHAKGRSLVVGFKKAGRKVARLSFADMKGGPRIRIPITQNLQTVPAEEVTDEWPTNITAVHFCRKLNIAPQPHHPTQGEQLIKLNNGWIYIFVNGILWREVQVIRSQSVRFADVALDREAALEQPRDYRPATGQTGNSVTIPVTIENQEVTVEIGFSQVQWSWARIESMGEVSPEGVPRDKWFPDEHPLNEKGKKLREQRLQLIPIKQGADNLFKDTIGDLGPADHCNVFKFDVLSAKQLPYFALNDFIGDAQDLAFSHQQAWRDMENYISEISNPHNVKHHPFAPWFDSAILANQYFFVEHPTITAENVSKQPPKTKDEKKQLKKAQQERQKWQAKLSLTDIQKALGTEHRKELRKNIRKTKDTLAAFLDKDAAHIQQFVAAFDDYCSRPAITRSRIKDVEDIDVGIVYAVCDQLLARLGDHEYSIDRTLETTPPSAAEILTLQKQDKGGLLLAQLVTPESNHPLYTRLFTPGTARRNSGVQSSGFCHSGSPCDEIYQ